MSFFFIRWSSLLMLVLVFATIAGSCTVNFCNVHTKLIAFFKDPLAAGFYEVVELDGELGHAVAQLVESEVDRGERFGH
jgi:hypothetical protein